MKLLYLISEFVLAYYSHAKEVERVTGLSANIILTQAANESSWGRSAKGNNFFGIKDVDGVNGNEQLCRTVEYHKGPCWPYPDVLSVTKKGDQYRYVVMDYFRKYGSPMEGFFHFSHVIECSFPGAWEYRCDPHKYFKNLKGYATSPASYTLHLKVLRRINREIYEIELSKSAEICQ